MDLKLKNKIALVTGSNRGTGEVIAQTLAREGAVVVFHGNEEGAAEQVAAGIENAHAVWGDIASDAGCDQVLQQTQSAVGTIDILVNNYGTATAGKWAVSNTEGWLDMYQKNVLSAARLIQGFSPAMREKGWGRIVQLGTIGSHQPNSIMPHYYASKGALATMSVSLTKELSHTGITVNTISPGYIRTAELEAGFRRRAEKKGWGDDWNDIVKNIVATEYPNPSGRIAERQEVADLVAFICSDLAGFINGQNIRIDGGAVAYV
ncbi:SDR family oxidoreductase [uncultured Zhongshania sp.]|uniref:SDR family NAD(P)-dependent oxidoreductase n=1 Tax=uncultured Zhongshania sp. TaxID=1642288 RepID=UPI0025E14C87|nr:SDR family oxidoreductase [uncultured Zhongshania sp.]